MKIATLAAAGLVGLTGIAPGLVAPAAAQHTVVTERTVVHRGPERMHSRRVCHNEMRHHHRVRICRTFRR